MAVAPPPVSSLSTWKHLPEMVSQAIFNPLVVVTIMTTVSLILGVIAIAPEPISKKILTLCFLIGLFGVVAIIYELRRLVRHDRARILISRLLAEGQQVVLYTSTRNPDRDTNLANQDWINRVEGVLRKYLDDSYVTRFHLGGSNQEDFRSISVWKQNHRLETLASFLREIK
jgi:hypothetical protein